MPGRIDYGPPLPTNEDEYFEQLKVGPVSNYGVIYRTNDEDTESKLTLPDVQTNYLEMAKVWEEFYEKVSGVEGWGSKSLCSAVSMVKLHLRLAGQHFGQVCTSIDSVNGEFRSRGADSSTGGRKRTFTAFYTKANDALFNLQCKLFKVQGVGEGRPKSVVISELVEAAMKVEDK